MKSFSSFFIILFLVLLMTAPFSACNVDDDDDKNSNTVNDDDFENDKNYFPGFTIQISQSAHPAIKIGVDDAASLLESAFGKTVTVLSSPVPKDDKIRVIVFQAQSPEGIFSQTEISQMAQESFRIRFANREGQKTYAICGADARGTRYGLYDLLEIFGFRFLHPEQTYMPTRKTLLLPEDIDIYESPSYERRGFHIHTMHPIEATEYLMRDKPEYLKYSQRLLDWHVRNKQNYMQFELLRTVDYDKTLDHFNAFVKYGHDRLMDMGLVVSWVFQQQKAWKILSSTRSENKEELEAGIDFLMQVPWDHINFEMGSSEFTKVKDTIQVQWMDNTAAYLREKYPETEASVKIHCSSGQTAPNFGDINFNFLAQFADTDMGVYPHTVQYYDLLGPAPAYDNEDFVWMYEWMLDRIGERKVYYYPETAYWCSFDIDVPLYLPIYIYNRWKDIALLSDKGIDGHITFTSGHEWSYWQNDWTVASYTWNASQDWKDAIYEFCEIFGEAGPYLAERIIDLTLEQEQMLIQENLASYIAGQDTWDELGYIAGTTTHPRPLMYKELYQMDADQIHEIQNNLVAKLLEMRNDLYNLMKMVSGKRSEIPINSIEWFGELEDSFMTNYFRAAHSYHLWAGACQRRLYELGEKEDGEIIAQGHFDHAKAFTPRAISLMRLREANYRYPLNLSIGWERSLTSYDFKYLWQASTGYWYTRYEKQAIDKNFSLLLDNVINPIWFMF